MKEVILIIPAYNEEKNIALVVDELIENYPELDYVVIDDGSADDTRKICEAKGYNMISLAVNLGLAGAFQTGMRYAYEKGYLYAVQFDGDNQHSAEYVELMLRFIHIKFVHASQTFETLYPNRKAQKPYVHSCPSFRSNPVFVNKVVKPNATGKKGRQIVSQEEARTNTTSISPIRSAQKKVKRDKT